MIEDALRSDRLLGPLQGMVVDGWTGDCNLQLRAAGVRADDLDREGCVRVVG